jgi:hypothetical protein
MLGGLQNMMQTLGRPRKDWNGNKASSSNVISSGEND